LEQPNALFALRNRQLRFFGADFFRGGLSPPSLPLPPPTNLRADATSLDAAARSPTISVSCADGTSRIPSTSLTPAPPSFVRNCASPFSALSSVRVLGAATAVGCAGCVVAVGVGASVGVVVVAGGVCGGEPGNRCVT